MAASFVIGQSDFIGNTAGTDATGFGYNSDVAVDTAGQLVFILDQYSNRVMVFDVSLGITNGMSATYVIGQPNLSTYTANTTIDGLSQPGGVYYDATTKQLFVGDQLNRRVVVYDLTSGVTNGMDATYVYGQGDFTSNISDTTQTYFKGTSPIGVEYDHDNRNLYVADYENNRLMIFSLPRLAAHTFDAGVVGESYSDGATLNNSQGTPSWSISSGSLPTGLSIDSSTGNISGTPTTAGTYNFSIEVDSVISPVQTFTDSRSYSITVTSDTPAVDDDEEEVQQSSSSSGSRSAVAINSVIPSNTESLETNIEDTTVQKELVDTSRDVESVEDDKSTEVSDIVSTRVIQENISIAQGLIKALNNSVPNAIKAAGILSGIALITVSSVIDVVTGSHFSSFGLRVSGLVSSMMGLRRRYKPWGTVYDSVTKQPIDPAIVTLYDLNGVEVASSITDQDGRYGFLVAPGVYRIKVEKANYSFPSTKLSNKVFDELYENLYFGDLITIESPDNVISKNIPMDNVSFDWNEFQKSKEKSTIFFSRWDLIIHRFFILSFAVGFIITAVSLVYFPVPYNYVTAILYVLIIVSRIFGIKPKSFGTVKDRQGKPLSFGIVKIYFPGTGDVMLKKVIDKYGRYSALVPPGEYRMDIEMKNDDESYTRVYSNESVKAKKGIVNIDVSL
jgi:hypothetical protein